MVNITVMQLVCQQSGNVHKVLSLFPWLATFWLALAGYILQLIYSIYLISFFICKLPFTVHELKFCFFWPFPISVTFYLPVNLSLMSCYVWSCCMVTESDRWSLQMNNTVRRAGHRSVESKMEWSFGDMEICVWIWAS